MMLSVDVHHRLGSFELNTQFESSGPLTALFGPSGAGKSSLVNLIGGLMRPDKGSITIDGRVLVDTASNVFLPKHRRRIGYVFQDARLFPHMTVGQNLRYGRFFTPSAERYADMAGVVELLGIGHLLDRKPNLLSGGEKQRVAIGRALVASPKLILMDEPLASLDDARKAEILPYIERLRDETKIPIVYVSHSIAEVARLATDIVVLSDGNVVASGSTDTILSRLDLLPEDERSEAGTVIELEVTGQDEEAELSILHSRGGTWRLPKIAAQCGDRVRVRIRARDILIATERPHGLSAINVLPVQVVEIAGSGAEAYVRLDCGGDILVARVTRHSAAALGLAPGRDVFAVVKAVTFDRSNMAYARSAARRN
jgi:molybdate transport system ATP-binding protein